MPPRRTCTPEVQKRLQTPELEAISDDDKPAQPRRQRLENVALSVPHVPQVEHTPLADDQVEGAAADETLGDASECLAI